jgi:hypothetical protein
VTLTYRAGLAKRPGLQTLHHWVVGAGHRSDRKRGLCHERGVPVEPRPFVYDHGHRCPGVTPLRLGSVATLIRVYVSRADTLEIERLNGPG